MRDLFSNLGAIVAIDTAALSADNTPAAIDLLGFDSALILLAVGAGGITFTGTNKVEFKLTHSEDGTNYDPVTIDDVQGPVTVGTGGIVSALTAAHASATVEKVGYVGNRRWLKLLADFGGTHASPTPISAIVVKGNPRKAPVA